MRRSFCLPQPVSRGRLGEVHPSVSENYEIGTRVYLASLSEAVMFAHVAPEKGYTPLPRFPASTRDLALICEDALPVAEWMQSFIWFILCNNGLDYTGFQLRISTPIVLSAFKTRFTAASASSSVGGIWKRPGFLLAKGDCRNSAQ